MKFYSKLLALATGLCITISTFAQTADEIVDLNIAAMGGKEKLASLKSYRMTGSMATQGVDVQMVLTKVHQKGYRIDMDINGTSNYQVANTEKGSAFMPIGGMSDPMPMEDAQYKSMVRQFDIQGALFDYKAKGTTITYEGKAVAEGSDAYKLALTYKDGNKSTFFIDTKTNRLLKSVTSLTMNGESMDIENTYADYHQNKDGYWFAYSITNRQGTIVIADVQTNVAVDESLFKN